MNEVRIIGARLRKRLAYLAVLSELIAGAYERTEDRRDRVRLSEVTRYVADLRDLPIAYTLRRDIREAAKLIGFRRVVRPAGVPHFEGMRPRV